MKIISRDINNNIGVVSDGNGTLNIKSGIAEGIGSYSGSIVMLQNITNSATTKYVYGGGIVIKGSTINPTT